MSCCLNNSGQDFNVEPGEPQQQEQISKCMEALLCDAETVVSVVESLVQSVSDAISETDCFITGYTFAKISKEMKEHRSKQASLSSDAETSDDDECISLDSDDQELLSEDAFFEKLNKIHYRPKNFRPQRVRVEPIKVPGELDVRDLPPVETLQLSVQPDLNLFLLGKISGIVDTLVVIESEMGIPALDLESVLFLEDRSAMGQVFDVFGPTQKPYYTVRFNSNSDITNKGLSVGTNILYAKDTTDYTHFILPAQLKQKGSDASWSNDIEPPPSCLDFSDDEAERNAKRKSKAKRSLPTKSDGDGNTLNRPNDHGGLNAVAAGQSYNSNQPELSFRAPHPSSGFNSGQTSLNHIRFPPQRFKSQHDYSFNQNQNVNNPNQFPPPRRQMNSWQDYDSHQHQHQNYQFSQQQQPLYHLQQFGHPPPVRLPGAVHNHHGTYQSQNAELGNRAFPSGDSYSNYSRHGQGSNSNFPNDTDNY